MKTHGTMIVAALVIAAASGVGTGSVAAQPSGRVPVEGGDLYYERSGEGDTVVLMHGYGLDLTMWDDVWPRFSAAWDAIRFDMRGHGRSSAQVPGDWMTDLAAVLDSLGVARASLVGLSVGGGIALEFAARFPHRVEKLVLVSMTGPPNPADVPALMRLASRIRTPTLVIWGAADEKAASFGVDKAIEGSRTSLIGGAGHLVSRDNPAEFFASVRDFLLD